MLNQKFAERDASDTVPETSSSDSKNTSADTVTPASSKETIIEHETPKIQGIPWGAFLCFSSPQPIGWELLRLTVLSDVCLFLTAL